MDGTLIDSEWFYYKAWRAALKPYGFELGSDLWLNELAGTTDGQAFEVLRSSYAFEADREKLFEEARRQIARQHEDESVPLMPGATHLIHFLYEREVIMAVVTSSKREVAIYHLERNGIRHFFSVLVTRTDVQRPKPDPEPYLRCVKELGLPNDHCVVLEDSFTGSAAAKSAGLTCFGVQSHEAIRQTLN